MQARPPDRCLDCATLGHGAKTATEETGLIVAELFQIQLANEAETRAFAAALAPLCRIGDALLLEGTLGAGKTAFARAFINALPGPDGEAHHEEVPSPTFTLLQIYERRPAAIWHFDLYRIEHQQDLEELGLDEALAEGITLVEWPDRMGTARPTTALTLTLDYGEEEAMRRLTVSGDRAWAERLRSMAR